MEPHWFAYLCWSIAVLPMVCLLYSLGTHHGKEGLTGFEVASGFLVVVLVIVGLYSAKLADKQNTALASRNTAYFESQGYNVLNAYGHKVCVAAGPNPVCFQERKDATGAKQLVRQLADGKWVLVHGPGSGFMDALSHAPRD